MVLLIAHVARRAGTWALLRLNRIIDGIYARRLEQSMRRTVAIFNGTMDRYYFVVGRVQEHAESNYVAIGLLAHDEITRSDATEFTFFAVFNRDDRTLTGDIVAENVDGSDRVLEMGMTHRDWNRSNLERICWDILERFYRTILDTRVTN